MNVRTAERANGMALGARPLLSARVRTILLRAAGATLLLVAIARMFDLRDVWRIVSSIQVAGIALILTLTVLSWIIGIAKWKVLLSSVAVPAIAAFYFIGLLYSLVLPGQLAGEAVKTARLAARGPGLAQVGASVVIDRLTSLVGLGIVSGIGLWLAGHHSPTFTLVGWIIWLFTVAFAALLFAVRLRPVRRVATRIAWTLRRRGHNARRLANATRRFLHAWIAYGADARLVVTSMVLALAFQLANVAIVTAIAVSLNVPLAFSDAAWIVGVVSIMTLVPVSFGGVGVREAGFVGLCGLIGIAAAPALSVSLVCSLIVVLAAVAGLLVELRWAHEVKPMTGGR